jgi:enolase
MLQHQDGENQKVKALALRAVSELLVFSSARCFNFDNIWSGLAESFYNPKKKTVSNTQMLINVFSGGKALNSTVKFSKFFLIIDNQPDTDPRGSVKIMDNMHCY